MQKLKFNKRANSQWLSPWFVLNWVIIIVALLIVSFWFFSHFSDVRAKEAQILNQKISSCLSSSFSLDEFNSSSFDIFSKCNLNSKLFADQGFYYIGLDLKDNGKELKSLDFGVNSRTECDYQHDSNKIEVNFPQCSFSNIDITDVKIGKAYQMQIIAASNQK
jgi:hypothetical protein